MKQKAKGQKGFTLLEIIISVAIISIVSLFILQFFIASSNANAKAQNIDIASTKAVSVIELVKSGDNFEELQKLGALGGMFSSWHFEDDNGVSIITVWFGEDWEQLDVSASESARFYMDISFTKPGTDGLSGIRVAVYDLKADGGELVSYDALKYYEGRWE
jgi:prepilin-type N-terminal cleavage/methylation domain-containing protein